MDFYRDDFSQLDLETQLEVFSQTQIECAGDSITFQGIYNSVSYVQNTMEPNKNFRCLQT